jgi:hypothetical protein
MKWECSVRRFCLYLLLSMLFHVKFASKTWVTWFLLQKSSRTIIDTQNTLENHTWIKLLQGSCFWNFTCHKPAALCWTAQDTISGFFWIEGNFGGSSKEPWDFTPTHNAMWWRFQRISVSVGTSKSVSTIIQKDFNWFAKKKILTL